MTTKLFRKVLIANRGEIACRVMRTCRRLAVRTVAVYSKRDEQALHVRMADQAVELGGASPQESYLAIGKIIAAAKATGAEAVHPGYGFLSENELFAEACADAGLTFIGPPASAIRAMGSKSAAKVLMEQAGVPLTPGYHGTDQTPEFLASQAEAIGYPVLIKASAGGGGKGMRRVDTSAEFTPLLQACKREAGSAFGDDHVLIEKYILRPRHIEVQVFGDSFGNIVSLFERDCSVQRRHQKVLEESPAPGMTIARREAMCKAARDAAGAVSYVGAGTVEFIVGADGSFSFMEMNTRLQVEHPVTEMITGLDLVEWQLRVAAGGPLPLTQDQLAIRGHAIEARVYAEDPSNGFLPSVGKIIHMHTPAGSQHVRVDAGVEQGDEITAFYDPMIAKMVVWDETRELALQQMTEALSGFEVVGVQTNIGFLQRLVTCSSFASADLDTDLIEREKSYLTRDLSTGTEEPCALAALALLLGEARVEKRNSPWADHDGWRLGASRRRAIIFRQNERFLLVDVEYEPEAYRLSVGEKEFIASGEWRQSGELVATINGVQEHVTVIENAGSYHVFLGRQSFIFGWVDPLAVRSEVSAKGSSLLAPIPGLVSALLVQPGSEVEMDTPLLVLEAMKMEITIRAPTKGIIRSFFFAPGDRVAEGTQLLQFERAEGAGVEQ